MINQKRVLFYASVNNVKLFSTQLFYIIDIEILSDLGYQVYTTNKLTDFFKFWKYNIAFIYFYRFGLFAAIISKCFLKKVYFTGGIDDLDAGFASPKNYNLQKNLFKLSYYFADKCIVVSSSDASNVKRIYNGRMPSRIFLSKHAIRLESFKSSESIKKESIFTTIAWMETLANVKRKGIDKALFLFSGLIKQSGFEESIFYIIGKEGDGSDFLKKICQDLNISEKVVFTGMMSEDKKIVLLNRSRYYFQLSKYEGFGLAALEALAAHNVVIHSGCGGLADCIGPYGIVIDVSRDDENVIDELLKNINNFNKFQFVESDKFLENNFSYLRRKNDFEKVML